MSEGGREWRNVSSYSPFYDRRRTVGETTTTTMATAAASVSSPSLSLHSLSSVWSFACFVTLRTETHAHKSIFSDCTRRRERFRMTKTKQVVVFLSHSVLLLWRRFFFRSVLHANEHREKSILSLRLSSRYRSTIVFSRESSSTLKRD